MKPILLSTPLCCAVLCGFTLSAHAAQEGTPAAPDAQAPDPDEIVLRVGPEEITRREHTKEVNRLIPVNYFHARVPSGRQRELQLQAMDFLIEKALIQLDARRRGLKVSDEELRQRFKQTLEQVGPQYANITETEFQELLAVYRSRVERKLLIEKNEARFEDSMAPITEEELRAQFAEMKGQLMSTETVRFRHILLKVAPSASAPEAHGVFRRLEEIKSLIDGGRPFEELAKEHSDDIFAQLGGDMGFVTRTNFVTPGLADRAFELKDGETSEVLNSIFGYHLLRRVESEPRRPLTFEEARIRLEETLRVEGRKRERAEWLASLKESYPVQVLVDFRTGREG